jgi:holin-like protein
MLVQISRVLFWLCIGELASRAGFPLPAPVSGVVLLYAELSIRGQIPPDLVVLADRLLQLLGLLFVPAGVGVIAYLDLFKAELIPIAAAIVGGTAVTLLTTAVVANRFGTARAAEALKANPTGGAVDNVNP